MATPSAMPARRGPGVLELLDLDMLPCGCVSAAYQSASLDLAVVTVEAKGPFCFHSAHTPGRMLQMGRLADLAAGDSED